LGKYRATPRKERGCCTSFLITRSGPAAALLGAPVAALDRRDLFALESPALFRLTSFSGLLAIVLFDHELILEPLHRAASFVHETAEISGHLRELAGTEDDQEKEPYEHHLLDADTEHEA
jgi:hypothetical protein